MTMLHKKKEFTEKSGFKWHIVLITMLFIAAAFPFASVKVKAEEVPPANLMNTTVNGMILSLTGTRLEFGDYVSSMSVSNSDKKEKVLYLYMLGKDATGNVLEVNGTQVSFKSTDTLLKAELRLKSGYLVKSVEVYGMDVPSQSVSLLCYGIRRDDQQNKIIITGTVSNNTADKRGVGILAQGYGSDRALPVEVQGASSTINKKTVKNFEIALLAGSLISDTQIRLTGLEASGIINTYGKRDEKGKTIITGNIENNNSSQYVQVIGKGWHSLEEAALDKLGSAAQLDATTLAINKNESGNYRFEMNEKNNIKVVNVKYREQGKVAGNGDLIDYSVADESGKAVVTAIVSSGYYKAKKLGIIARVREGKESRNREVNTAYQSFDANKCQVKLVTLSLETLKDSGEYPLISIEIIGKLEDTVKLHDYGWRVENGKLIVTSVVENGNTVAQTIGVRINGYGSNGSLNEVSGYSDRLDANTTKQYKTILNNVKQIASVDTKENNDRDLIPIVKDKLETRYTECKNVNRIFISGILLNGSRKHMAGFLVLARDAAGKTIGADCYYGSLSEDSVSTFYLELNHADKIKRIDKYIVEEGSYTPLNTGAPQILDPEGVYLNGYGFYKGENGELNISGVAMNKTSLRQSIGLFSIGYDKNNKPVEFKAERKVFIDSMFMIKLQGSLVKSDVIRSITTILTGVPCATKVLADMTETKNGYLMYAAAVQNGVADQKFTMKVITYDLNGKLVNPPNEQKMTVTKDTVKVINTQFNTKRASKVIVEIYDASKKLLKRQTFTFKNKAK